MIHEDNHSDTGKHVHPINRADPDQPSRIHYLSYAIIRCRILFVWFPWFKKRGKRDKPDRQDNQKNQPRLPQTT